MEGKRVFAHAESRKTSGLESARSVAAAIKLSPGGQNLAGVALVRRATGFHGDPHRWNAAGLCGRQEALGS
jgi:hypothetical protein